MTDAGTTTEGDRIEFVCRPSPIKKHIKGIVVFVIFEILFYTVLNNYIPDDLSLYLQVGMIILIFIVTWFSGFLYQRFNEIDVSNSAISVKRGILSTKTIVVPYAKITDMNVHRSFTDRILGLGMLHINTAGTTSIEVVFPDLRKKDLERITELFRAKVGERYEQPKDQ